MTRVRVLVLLAAMASSASAAAQQNDPSSGSLPSLPRFNGAPPMQIERRGFSFPLVEYAEPTGTIQRRQGIIAGKKVAPGTVLGFGLFQTTPRMRGYVGDMPPNLAPRRSKRAAIGLSVRF